MIMGPDSGSLAGRFDIGGNVYCKSANSVEQPSLNKHAFSRDRGLIPLSSLS
jgi:hypothetical protein